MTDINSVISFQDVNHLARELNNVTLQYLIKDRFFSHIDFIWANQIDVLVNYPVIEHMEKFIDKSDKDP